MSFTMSPSDDLHTLWTGDDDNVDPSAPLAPPAHPSHPPHPPRACVSVHRHAATAVPQRTLGGSGNTQVGGANSVVG